MKSPEKRPNLIVTAGKVALGYLLFIGIASVMTVIGMISIPLGLLVYLFTLPFRRRSSGAAG